MGRYILVMLFSLLGCGESPKKEPVTHSAVYKKYEGGACIGLSAFAIMGESFQGETCERFLDIQSVTSCTTTALLWGSFGNNPSCLYRYIDQAIALNQELVIEVHFSSEVLRKKGVLNQFDFYPGLSFSEINKLLEAMPDETKAVIKTRITSILDAFAPYQDYVHLIISVGLEDQFTMKARSNLTAQIMEHWPYDIAWNPDGGDAVPYGLYNERHHYDKAPHGRLCIRNGDGQDVSFLSGGGVPLGGGNPASLPDVMDWGRKSLTGGCITILWASKHQGITGIKESPTLSRVVSIPEGDVPVIQTLFKDLWPSVEQPR